MQFDPYAEAKEQGIGVAAERLPLGDAMLLCDQKTIIVDDRANIRERVAWITLGLVRMGLGRDGFRPDKIGVRRLNLACIGIAARKLIDFGDLVRAVRADTDPLAIADALDVTPAAVYARVAGLSSDKRLLAGELLDTIAWDAHDLSHLYSYVIYDETGEKRLIRWQFDPSIQHDTVPDLTAFALQ
ncbi:hypothetical protein [Rhodococcus opacus]|uniref:hypothetical protein n=1 Tax=Rhodococcus opacus TaxID=37919 RepID=UPI001C44C674|nr:hypothetical protein [Rhodococcus opacus]MBV6758423.1 hypothetical protein [Rhodococcus opacus]